MLVWTNVATDSRVLREATALVAAGHAVHIIGKDVPADFVPPAGVTVQGATGTSSLKRAAGSTMSRRLSPPMRIARWALLPNHVAASHRAWVGQARVLAHTCTYDVIHAHDFTALPLAAELAAETRVRYVYDTHEYWYGRPWSGRPALVRRWLDRRSERELGSAAAAIITVGDGVAEQLAIDFGWTVTVVRNTFALPEPGAGYGPVHPAGPTGVVYAGRIGGHRDLETVLAAAPALAPLTVTLVGPADPTYLAALDPGSAEVLDALAVSEVTDLLRERGVALVALADHGENHRLAMPNKLFHAVHAGVPVVAADVEHLARLVREHGLGTVYRPGDVVSLLEAIRAVRAGYPGFVEAVRRALPALSWPHDAERLVSVYAALEGSA